MDDPKDPAVALSGREPASSTGAMPAPPEEFVASTSFPPEQTPPRRPAKAAGACFHLRGCDILCLGPSPSSSSPAAASSSPPPESLKPPPVPLLRPPASPASERSTPCFASVLSAPCFSSRQGPAPLLQPPSRSGPGPPGEKPPCALWARQIRPMHVFFPFCDFSNYPGITDLQKTP